MLNLITFTKILCKIKYLIIISFLKNNISQTNFVINKLVQGEWVNYLHTKLGKMKDMGGGDELSKMFKEMAKKMGMGNNVKINKNALDKLTKMEDTREKMKSRALQKKMKDQADFEKRKEEIRKRIEEQQKIASNYSLNPTDATNEFVFRLEGEDKQEKSFIHPDLIKEMQEQETNNGNNGGKSGENKKKKKKTKK